MSCEQLFADVSSKIIALADPILSQPDMEREMVSPPAGAYITLIHDLQRITGPSGEMSLITVCKLFVMVHFC